MTNVPVDLLHSVLAVLPPVAIATAAELHLSPLPLMIGVAGGASASF